MSFQLLLLQPQFALSLGLRTHLLLGLPIESGNSASKKILLLVLLLNVLEHVLQCPVVRWVNQRVDLFDLVVRLPHRLYRLLRRTITTKLFTNSLVKILDLLCPEVLRNINRHLLIVCPLVVPPKHEPVQARHLVICHKQRH